MQFPQSLTEHFSNKNKSSRLVHDPLGWQCYTTMYKVDYGLTCIKKRWEGKTTRHLYSLSSLRLQRHMNATVGPGYTHVVSLQQGTLAHLDTQRTSPRPSSSVMYVPRSRSPGRATQTFLIPSPLRKAAVDLFDPGP